MKKVLNSHLEIKSLKILSLLLKNPSITSVAKQMAMQPPSVTYHLNKLRESLSDPLFVQVGNKMLPTQRATALIPKLSKLFDNIDDIVHSSPFEPASINQHFRIAIQDVSAEILIPKLVNQLAKVAPNITIQIVSWPSNAEQKVHQGEIDIAINAIVNLSSQLYGYQLSDMSLSLVTRKDHVLATSDYKTEDIFDFPHVRVEPAALGEGRVDELALKLSKRRRIIASGATFSVLSSIIKESDSVGVFPTGTALQLDQTRFFCKQLDELPTIPVHCFWHQRSHHDLAHKFLRGLIIELSLDIISKGGFYTSQ
ncbi:LysR family transcriptional regulator [Vibrio parahaemolyticus]|uniref:LysR family transcriptional regulator n=1 Tax=Vibrio mediterranei TaxID=689 RepID=UPI004067B4C2